jgi:hypothetical protein
MENRAIISNLPLNKYHKLLAIERDFDAEVEKAVSATEKHYEQESKRQLEEIEILSNKCIEYDNEVERLERNRSVNYLMIFTGIALLAAFIYHFYIR